MELISIIVPIYNVEQYLEECIVSLINQTYTELEIILVDDGSTDSSGKICDEFEKKDQRIKVLHKKNEGLGFARNSGLELANGQWVTFIDSDDYAEVDMISKLIENAVKYNADTCIGGFKKVDDKNVLFIEKYEKRIYKNEEVYNELFYKMLGSEPEKHDMIRMSVWNVLYSMKIIKENEIKFPSERVFISEDIIFDSDYYQHAQKVCIIDSTAYNYRLTDGSLTQKYKENRAKLYCVLYREIERRISGDVLFEEGIRRLQKHFFVNIRACVAQEKSKILCDGFFEVVRRIQQICDLPEVVEVTNCYPVNRLQFKQRIFVRLLKQKNAMMLAVLAQLNVV